MDVVMSWWNTTQRKKIMWKLYPDFYFRNLDRPFSTAGLEADALMLRTFKSNSQITSVQNSAFFQAVVYLKKA